MCITLSASAGCRSFDKSDYFFSMGVTSDEPKVNFVRSSLAARFLARFDEPPPRPPARLITRIYSGAFPHMSRQFADQRINPRFNRPFTLVLKIGQLTIPGRAVKPSAYGCTVEVSAYEYRRRHLWRIT